MTKPEYIQHLFATGDFAGAALELLRDLGREAHDELFAENINVDVDGIIATWIGYNHRWGENYTGEEKVPWEEIVRRYCHMHDLGTESIEPLPTILSKGDKTDDQKDL